MGVVGRRPRRPGGRGRRHHPAPRRGGPHPADRGDGRPAGRLCRRALGLATPPPDAGPLSWWARLWLDRLFRAAAAAPGRRWTWANAAAAHPLHGALRPSGGGLRPGAFAVAVGDIADGIDWHQIRRAAAALPDAWLAEWMDDGCYARWVLDEYPVPSVQMADLAALLPRPLLASLDEVLTTWGLLP